MRVEPVGYVIVEPNLPCAHLTILACGSGADPYRPREPAPPFSRGHLPRREPTTHPRFKFGDHPIGHGACVVGAVVLRSETLGESGPVNNDARRGVFAGALAEIKHTEPRRHGACTVRIGRYTVGVYVTDARLGLRRVARCHFDADRCPVASDFVTVRAGIPAALPHANEPTRSGAGHGTGSIQPHATASFVV